MQHRVPCQPLNEQKHGGKVQDKISHSVQKTFKAFVFEYAVYSFKAELPIFIHFPSKPDMSNSRTGGQIRPVRSFLLAPPDDSLLALQVAPSYI